MITLKCREILILVKILIKTLNLNISKTDISTVEKISILQKEHLDTSWPVLITLRCRHALNRDFWSRHYFKNRHLDTSKMTSQYFTTSLDYSKISQNLDWDSWSWHLKNWHLHCWENLDSLKKNIFSCRDISISIALNCRDPQA